MSAKATIATAAAHFQRQDLEAAEATCRSIIAAEPEDAEAMHLLGLVRRRRGDLGEAESLIRRSIELRPGNAEFRINLSNLFVATGRLADAERALRTVLAAEPSNRAAGLALARVLHQGRANEAAEGQARALLEADDADAEAWSVLGNALRDQERLAEAEAAFREALRCRPDYAVAQHNLGSVLARMRRAEEALAELDKAASLGVSGAAIDTNRASALIELQQFDEAERLLASAAKAAPGFADAQERLAKLRYMRGDSAWLRDLERAAAQTGDLRLELLLGDLLRRAGAHERALAILTDVAGRHPGVPFIESSLAVVLQEAGELTAALDRARAAFSVYRHDRAISENLVAILLQSGMPEEAAPIVAEWRKRAPEDQRWITYEATAAAAIDPERFAYLFDFERFVRPFDVEPPAGMSVDEFNSELARCLSSRHALSAHPLDQSLRNGTQTSRELTAETDLVIRQFLQAIREPLEAYCSGLGSDPAHPFVRRNRGGAELVGAWSVRLGSGGYHVNHIHPQGWISSAYYVDVPGEVAATSERTGWIKFGEPRMPVPGVEARHFVRPQRGRLVLFPSYMWHGTIPLTGAEPRLTIAFDAKPMRSDTAVR